MPIFRYKALAQSGELLEGELTGRNRDAVYQKLRKIGAVPLQANPVSPSGKVLGRLWIGQSQPKLKDVLTFTRELGVLTKAGLTVDKAIDNIAKTKSSPVFRTTLTEISESVKSGYSLASALKMRTDVFPLFYVALIHAGERSGALNQVLFELTRIIQRTEELTTRIKSALLYPIIVFVLIAMTFAILMVWVLPQFRPILEGQGDALPLNARIVLDLSEVTVNHGWLFLLGLAVSALVFQRLSREGRFVTAWHRRLLSLPKVGSIVQEIEMARYCRSLSTLIQNGIRAPEATEIASSTIANQHLSHLMQNVRGAISKGETLANAVRASGQMPETMLQLITVGEESGQLADMLLLAADTAESDVQKSLELLMTLLVPIVTIFLGILVALVIGSILSAILSTYNVPV